MSEQEKIYKVIIIGDSGTGKSSIVLRYCNNEFSDSFSATIGVDFKKQYIKVDDKLIRINIWDTAGQERFRSITRSYYRHSDAVVIVFDITNKNTFINVKEWIIDICKFDRSVCPIILVGCKADREQHREVKVEEINHLIESYPLNISYVEASAKTGKNINNIFDIIAKQLVDASSKEPLKINNLVKRESVIQKNHENQSCCSIL